MPRVSAATSADAGAGHTTVCNAPRAWETTSLARTAPAPPREGPAHGGDAAGRRPDGSVVDDLARVHDAGDGLQRLEQCVAFELNEKFPFVYARRHERQEPASSKASQLKL